MNVSRETTENGISLIISKQIRIFSKGISLLHQKLTVKQTEQFISYIEQLLLWNQKINLFSGNDELRLAERHVLECVSAVNVFQQSLISPVMDLGSGAGFPGIPLAILNPRVEIFLVESKKKKARFLHQVVSNLNLSAQVIAERAEDLIGYSDFGHKYAFIFARAVAPLARLLDWTLPLLKPGGRLITFKGDMLQKELKELGKLKSSFEKNKNNHLNFKLTILDYEVFKNIADKPELETRKAIEIKLKAPQKTKFITDASALRKSREVEAKGS